MTASKMSTFLRSFGVLIDDLVPIGDPVWNIYLINCKIWDIVTSTCIQPQYSISTV